MLVTAIAIGLFLPGQAIARETASPTAA